MRRPGPWARAKPGARPGRQHPRYRMQSRARHRPKPRRKRRRARAERHRGGRSPSPTIKARVGPEAHSCGVRPRFSLRAQGRARRQRGVAGQGPSDAGEGAASLCRAEPGSGREPTRVGSGPAPAIFRARRRGQAAKASPGEGRATQGRGPSPPGGARVGLGANSLGVGPGGSPLSRSKARPGCAGVAKQERSNVGKGAAVPTGLAPGGAKSGWGRKATRVGSGPAPARARTRRRSQAAKA